MIKGRFNEKRLKKINILDFPKNISKNERKVEAILFSAVEPLDIETIEKDFPMKKIFRKF